MAGLQRSSGTFRRSGSSGLVWEWEDKHLSGEIRPAAAPRGVDVDVDGGGGAARAPEASAAVRVIDRSRSSGHGGGYRAAAGRVSPAADPPSPRVALCGGGFCGFFGGNGKARKKNDAGKPKRKGRRH